MTMILVYWFKPQNTNTVSRSFDTNMTNFNQRFLAHVPFTSANWRWRTLAKIVRICVRCQAATQEINTFASEALCTTRQKQLSDICVTKNHYFDVVMTTDWIKTICRTSSCGDARTFRSSLRLSYAQSLRGETGVGAELVQVGQSLKCWSFLHSHRCPWYLDCWIQIHWTTSTPWNPSPFLEGSTEPFSLWKLSHLQ